MVLRTAHSLSWFCGRGYATGREGKVLRTSRFLCCIIRNSMIEAETNVRLLEPHISLSYLVGEDMREGENVRFFEPHILSPVLLERVRERMRICGSDNRVFSLLVFWRGCATGRERKVRRTSRSVLSHMQQYGISREKCAAQRTARFSLLFCGRRYGMARLEERHIQVSLAMY